ncbi:MAG: hypothetical protein RMI34_11360 [Chloroherpetonaceae bacterium]|nr:hypothetical protein [Chloroherpetonaceae bacterium]MCS7210197.1 hypothetical protein [Chloroherpetonaceae bacterium]MDW8020659.1 hypothetical protein [Chloroherpetonaceae bacterium]MDW8466571.1 hypothetical protein [Chloroherpetonaceae bacterium]
MPVSDTPQQKAARTRQRFRAMIVVLVLLCVEFVNTSINAFVTRLDKTVNPYLLTALGMVIVVVLFYPAFEFLSRWSHRIVEKLIEASSSVFGRKYAIVVVALLLLFLLYAGFLFLWFNKFLLSELFRSLQKLHLLKPLFSICALNFSSSLLCFSAALY